MPKIEETVNLPRTAFPMRANLPEREPEIQASWERLDVYGRLRRLRAGRPRFILHDGPPYANGTIHIGTALNKVLKDVVVRFASMRGFDAPFVPGWDTHGLPIEHKAIQELGLDRKAISPAELRDHCAGFARRYIGIMTGQFKRLGVLGDWDHPYVTLDPAYEARQVEVFGEMARRGYIYKGLRSVYWCATCETALAEAEVEYRNRRSPSIYVGFEVADGRGILPAGARVVIWTTTPWTLPGNVAIALRGDGPYVLVRTDRGDLLLAEPLAPRVVAALALEERGRSGPWPGDRLAGVRCRHPFLEREVPVIPGGDLVSLEEGTGCVHIAPGHGPEDFDLGRRHGLPVPVPVDGRGVLTAEAGPFAGLAAREANEAIPRALRASGHLLGQGAIEHQYAHCWRCKDPVLYRATEQWFASVEGFRREALQAIGTVRWIPAWGEVRIRNMVAERADWCISRQRAWGVPIPAFYCEECQKPLITPETIRAVSDLFRREGSNAWFLRSPEEILPPGLRCPSCGGASFRKETDTMDVWFDSGSSHAAVLDERPELRWPADLYLEGSDQHRGWFQSSLLTAVATRGQAPYRAVLTHGFVVDAEGRKMSKSLGNVVDPGEVIRQYGADILRLWVASTDYSGDVRVSPDILRQLAEVYRKIRNTLRFLLGNLYDFDPDADRVPPEALPELDRWALHRTGEVLQRALRAYEEYQYHLVFRALYEYCVADLSAFYLDVLKDRLYTAGPSSAPRRAAQTALHAIARVLTAAIAPILPHTADEAWGHLPRLAGDPESVHLLEWPEPPAGALAPELLPEWDVVLRVREDAARALEAARNAGLLRDSLEASLAVYPSPAAAPALARAVARWEAQGAWEGLAHLLRVSEARLVTDEVAPPADACRGEASAVKVGVAEGRKCPRCWFRTGTVGRDPRHPELCARCAATVEEHFARV